MIGNKIADAVAKVWNNDKLTANQPSKFGTKSWVEINYYEKYKTGSQIRYKTMMLK